MNGWLLDTNVISELRRPSPDVRVTRFVDMQPIRLLYTSVVTFAEVRFGIGRIVAPNRRAELERWLEQALRPWFADRLLPIDEDTILRWREMLDAGRRRGHTFSQPDLFIAATADLARLIVVSRDLSDFVAAGVPIYDPWQEHLHARDRSYDLRDVPLGRRLDAARNVVASGEAP